jgi:hypothetical protein
VVHGHGSALAPAVGVCSAKELSREGERRYTKLSMQERMRMQFDNMVHDARKNLQKLGGSERGAVTDSNRKP